MACLVLFGPGYTGSRIAATLGAEPNRFDDIHLIRRDTTAEAVSDYLARATHIISTVPPSADCDPILDPYHDAIARVGWIGYLSSTGVYGDTAGGWVDESAPSKGRRGGRVAADLAWQAIGARVFRLPGIYGPGRSVIERLRTGQAHRIDLPGQVFCRVHVDDIVAAIRAALDHGPAGIFNITDDLPAPQNDVVEYGCELLGLPVPPRRRLDELNLSAAARAFYAENRRVTNGKAKRLLGWTPLHTTYRDGLRTILNITTKPSPMTGEGSSD